MVIRNRILNFIYRFLSLAVGVFTLICVFNADSIDSFGWNAWRYFGTWVTTYGVFVLFIETFLSFFWLLHKNKRVIHQIYGQLLFVSLALEVALALTRPVSYLFIHGGNVLTPYFSNDRLLTQLLTYVFFPILVFGDWFLFSEKGNWKWHWVIYLIAIPCFYGAFSILNHYIRTSTTFACLCFDNNTFLNFAILGEWNGWVGVILSIGTLLLLYISVSFFMVFLSYSLSGKYARRTISS
ncbi:MAG TPA: hypothetical protein DDW18_00560 [Firmicutes bacterium]|nr:hypothetical protein [Bacillota bacterium]